MPLLGKAFLCGFQTSETPLLGKAFLCGFQTLETRPMGILKKSVLCSNEESQPPGTQCDKLGTTAEVWAFTLVKFLAYSRYYLSHCVYG